jgi:tetratricopeptide (TPR) repeat protein
MSSTVRIKYLVICLIGFLIQAPSQAALIDKICCPITPRFVESLPTAWTSRALHDDADKELFFGTCFAKELDLYRAITAFKRSRYLAAGTGRHLTKLHAEFSLALAYYLAQRYQQSISLFEESSLDQLTPESPYYKALLLILFDSYLHRQEYTKAHNVLALAQTVSPPIGLALEQYQHIALNQCSDESKSSIETKFYADYEKIKKSPFQAGLFNAVIPGAGYMYVGQLQSGITSFLLNALFITASRTFFTKGHTAAGIITAGFEAGWYFGGIRGSYLAAKEYNEYHYIKSAKETLSENRLFPVLLLDIGF